MIKDAGFTLLELLVVIAIIGSLASVILIAVNSANGKAHDASIKSNLRSINNFSAEYYDAHGSYGTATVYGSPNCQDPLFTSSTIAKFVAEAEKRSNNTALCILGDTTGQYGLANSWAISVPLKTNPQKSWCVDGDGFSNIANASYDGPTDKAFCSTL